ncbi:MAG: glycosyltransferase family 4 protein [Verrucomicrobia bacterium]|nr:glycosyltransferase family 4 protein [Deltaproteobacteria bacterium]
MKIVFLAPFGIRPKGTVIARMIPLAVELQRMGHRVIIVAPPYTNPEDSGREETVQGVTLRNVRLGPRHKVLAAPLLAWRMFREVLVEKPDLVHLFKPKGYGGLAAMLILCLKSLGLSLPPLVVDSDDWEGKGGMNDIHPYQGLEKRFYAFQEAWILKRAAAVTVASRGLQREIGRLGIPAERTFYLPNGVGAPVSADGAAIRSRHDIAPETPVLLLYTRFFEFDQARLHRVLAAIRVRVPAVRFLVVGKGRVGEELLLRKRGDELGFGDALILCGWVEPAELPAHLHAADVAIYPLDDNLINRCKCPAKLTEILLAGVPVVADRVGQAAEYVADGISGVLCDPAEPEAMAAAAARLLSDPGQRRVLGAAGRAYLLEHFTWLKYAEKLNEFYRKLVTT